MFVKMMIDFQKPKKEQRFLPVLKDRVSALSNE